MNRPAFLIAIISTVSAILLYLFGVNTVFTASMVLFATVIVLIVLKKKYSISFKMIVALFISGLLCIHFCFTLRFVNRVSESLSGKSGEVLCTVIEEPLLYDNGTLLFVKTSREPSDNSDLCKELRLQLFVSVEHDAAFAELGDVVKAWVEFSCIDDAYKKNSYSQQQYVSARCKSASIVGHRKSLYEPFVNLRKELRRNIDLNLNGSSAALLKGILLGDKSALNDEIISDFKACGVSHITAVSGLHIGILCGAFLSLFSLILSKRKAALISILPLFSVVIITGFTPSAIRAGIMCAITLLGTAFLQRGDSINSLGLAVVIMLAYNPFYVLDLSFQLSCSATLGVIVFSDFGQQINAKLKIKNARLKLIVTNVLLIIVQSIGAIIFTLPIQIIEFGYVSLISPIANVLISLAVTYSLSLSVAAIAFSYIPIISIIGKGIFCLISLLLQYIILVVHYLAKVPFSSVPFGSDGAILWLTLSLILVSLWFALKRAGGIKFIASLVAALLIVFLWSDAFIRQRGVRVAAIDVGDGFCTVVSMGDKGVVIGCGDEKTDRYIISNYLKANGITDIEAVIMPSQQEVCFGGYSSLLKFVSPKTVVVSAESKDIHHASLQKVSKQDGFNFSIKDMDFKVLDTQYGLVCVITYCDKVIVISCCSYNADEVTKSNIDLLVTSRAIPTGFKPDVSVVTSSEFFIDIEIDLLNSNKIFTNKHETIIIKFTQKGDVKVYAKQF